jgi:hypothetical protein
MVDLLQAARGEAHENFVRKDLLPRRRPRQNRRCLGVGRTTIERAEAIVEAAEEEPDEYGHLVEQMDRSGKVAGVWRLEVLKQVRQLESAVPTLLTGPFQVIVADPALAVRKRRFASVPDDGVGGYKGIAGG